MVTLPAKHARLVLRMAQARFLPSGANEVGSQRGQGFLDGLTNLLGRQCPGVALVPFQQGAVNLFAGIANRAAYSEIGDDPALSPINKRSGRNLEVQRNLTLRHERAW